MADEPTIPSPILDLAGLKTYVGISEDNTDEDAKLQIIIDAVNLSIDQYVGRTLASTEYEDQLLDGPGTAALCLPNFPVTEITSIYCLGFEVLQADPGYPPWNGWYMRDGGESGIIFHPASWPNGRAVIQITYTAGYTTIPADIYMGALEMAAFYRAISKKTGVIQENLGSYSVSLANALSNMNGELTIPSIPFQMILNRYRVNYYSHLVY